MIDRLNDRVIVVRLDRRNSAYDVVLDQTGGEIALAEPIRVSFVLADLLTP